MTSLIVLTHANRVTLKERKRYKKKTKADAYETAKNGGKHGKFYEQYKERPSIQIERGIRSFEKRIFQHLKKIKNPIEGAPDFFERTIEGQKGLLEHWMKEIKIFEEEIEILNGILKSRG